MDTFNLATTFCPNLVSGSSVIQDTQMCAIVGGPTVFFPSDGRPKSPLGNHNSSTLGSVIKMCIENYFDIFEEHYDRTVGDTMRPSISQSAELNGLFTNSPRTPAKESRSHQGSPSPLPVPSRLPTSSLSGQGVDSDYEDSDEAMLVMPIEPFISPARNRDASSIQHETPGFEHPPIMAYSSPSNPRRIHRFNDSSSGAKTKSPTSPIRGTTRIPAGRSKISIEGSPDGRRSSGSITVGRGARNVSGPGAGVEAYGVTAVGSFSPPTSTRH